MIKDLKPYAEYKESGLAWLGEVPRHWTVLPAFGAFKPNKARNIGMKEKTVLSLSYGRIVIKPAEKLHGLVPESFETYQIVDPGDIVLRTTDLQNDHTSLRVGMVRDRGIITSAYLALRALTGVSPDYCFQFLNVWDSSKAIYGYGSGLRQSLDFSHFKMIYTSVPPPAEQAAIVHFLDWANGRLERAIRAKRKVIALLNEQKQAIIHRAVTRGLDPSVALKPSGIPWLGEIPEHWEIKRGKSYLTAIDERSKTGMEELLTVSSARGVVPRRTINVTMFKAESYTGHKLCWPDDLVVNSLWAWAGGLGVSEHHGIISTAYSVYRARRSAEINPRFLHELVRSSAYQWELQVRSKGVWISRLQLTDTAFLDSPIPLPPPAEQAAIVVHLDATLAAFNSAISRLECESTLLREYRTRLIADVVTGKLDVREAAARLPDEELLPDLAAADEEPDDLPIEEEDDA